METKQVRSFREAIRRLQRDLGGQWRSDAGCCGITVAQCHALMELGKSGDLSLGELATELGLDNSTLSRTIDNMVRSGLVTRHANSDDRRYVSISLTRQGWSVYESIDQTFNTYFTDVLQLIPAAKREQVRESIGLLAEAVRQLNQSDCCREDCGNG